MDERNDMLTTGTTTGTTTTGTTTGTTTTGTENMDDQHTGDQSTGDQSGPRKLRRTRDGRIIAGVASGIGAYVKLDANIIRLALAIATFFGGAGAFIYAAGWLLIPEEGEDRSILENFIKNQQNKQSGF